MENNITAPLILVDYVWELIKANTDLKESTYEGKVPVVPMIDVSRVSKYGKPHLVFAYSEDAPMGPRAMGNMSFAVNAARFSEVNTIVNILTRALSRDDESATDVNEFSSTIPSFIGIRFGSINITTVEVDEPEESEGGVMQGLVNIRYEYYTEYPNLKTSLASWNGTAYIRS